jgi:hypothetical protein
MMRQRVILVPRLVAIGVWLVAYLVNAVQGLVDRGIEDGLLRRSPSTWTLPALPDLGWLVFLGVFFAVHLSALRGATHAERRAVGIFPAILAVAGYSLVVAHAGLSGVAAAGGFLGGLAHGEVTLGAVAYVRHATTALLGTIGTCLAATWLYEHWVGRLARDRGDAPRA